MHLTIKQLEELHAQYPEYQMELVEGKIIVMGPSDYLSEEVIATLVRLLGNWVVPRKLGRITGSSAGFKLPNATNDLRAPDVTFIRAERLRRSPRDFADLVPDLMVEVKSETDRIKPLEDKILQFLDLGTQVGMLVDPDKETVTSLFTTLTIDSQLC